MVGYRQDDRECRGRMRGCASVERIGLLVEERWDGGL